MRGSPFAPLAGAVSDVRASEGRAYSSAFGVGPWLESDVAGLRRAARGVARRLGVNESEIGSDVGAQRDGSGAYVVLPSGLTGMVLGLTELAATARYDQDRPGLLPEVPSVGAGAAAATSPGAPSVNVPLDVLAFQLDQLAEDSDFIEWARSSV